MSNIKKVEIPLHVGDTAEFTKTVNRNRCIFIRWYHSRLQSDAFQ